MGSYTPAGWWLFAQPTTQPRVDQRWGDGPKMGLRGADVESMRLRECRCQLPRQRRRHECSGFRLFGRYR